MYGRMRERRGTMPPDYGGPWPYESFVDDPVPSKSWKKCSHRRTRILEYAPATGGIQYSWYPPSARIWSIPSGVFEPSFPSKGSVAFEGPELVLPSIDLASMALEKSRSSSNVAEILSTCKQTMSSLVRPWEFLKFVNKNGLSSIQGSRRPLRELRAGIDRAASTWLEGTYGYLPLISDLAEIYSLATDPKRALSNIKPEVQYIRNIVSGDSAVIPVEGVGEYNVYITGKRSMSLERCVRINWDINPTFFTMSYAQQMASYLGLRDYGRLAWELVPYSFVADWFTNVGKSLAASAALNGPLMYCVGSVSSWTRTVTTTSMSLVGPRNPHRNDYTLIISSGGVCSTEEVNFVRSAAGEGDVDGAMVWNGLNSYRTASGIALLVGAAKSIIPKPFH